MHKLFPLPHKLPFIKECIAKNTRIIINIKSKTNPL